MVSKLVGGAKRLEKLLDLEFGKRNIQSARNALKKASIPIVAEDVSKTSVAQFYLIFPRVNSSFVLKDAG